MDDSDKASLETIVKILNDAVAIARAFLEDEEEEHTTDSIQVHVDYLQQKIAGVERTAASISRRKQTDLLTDALTEDASALIRDLKLKSTKIRNELRKKETAAAAAAAAARNEVESTAQLQVVMKKPPLPPMQIPKFSGDPLQYSNFITIFEETVHKNETLASSQKLLYLQSFMEGEAKKLIEKLLISDANYAIALDTLRINYGQPRQTVTVLYQRLAELPRCRNDPFSIRNTYNEMEAIFQMLENAGIEVNDSDYLRQEAYRKYPFNFIRQIVRSPDIELKELRQLLRNEVEMLIQLSQTAGYVPLETHRTKPYPNRQRNRASGTQQSTHHQSSDQQEPAATESSSQASKTSEVPAQKGTTSAASAPATKSAATWQFQRSAPTKSTDGYKGQSSTFQKTAHCPFCQENHHAEDCQNFVTATARLEKLGKTRCSKCFRQTHEGQPCIRDMQCRYCRSNEHNRALCPQKYPDQAKKVMFVENQEKVPAGLFVTLMVKASNAETKKTAHLRVMVDQACNTTTMTEDAARHLGVSFSSKQLQNTTGMGGLPVQPVTKGTVNIMLHTIQDGEVQIPVHLTTKIAQDVPVYSVEEFRSQYPDHGYIIPPTGAGQPIDIILGTDVLLRFLTLQNSVYVSETCQLLSTRFGHLIIAEKSETQNHSEPLSYFTRSEDIVKLMWDLDLVGLKNLGELDAEYEERALKLFYDSIRYVNGRYEVHWPWRSFPPNLNENFGLAIGRLRALLKKLSQNPELLAAYHQIIETQISEGVVEDAPKDRSQQGPVVHYIPHHAVIVMEKSTPVRVVMDAKATIGRSKSLNDNILKGTKWLGNTIGSLIRFRRFKKAVSSDVKHAFHQISIAPKERDAVRFLWVYNPSKPPTGENLRVLRFTRVAFGVVASPFLLYATIQYHLRNNPTAYSEIIASEMYADNLLASFPSETDSLQFYETTKQLFASMSMNITKWKTNDYQLQQQIPIEDKLQDITISVLGLNWTASTDELALRQPKIEDLLQMQPTKRIILKIMASIFDPLGWIAPFILSIRKFLRKLWEEKLSWDTLLQTENQELWYKLREEITTITQIKMSRMFFVEEINDQDDYELHTFVDASIEAMGCITYLRRTGSQNEVSIVMAKSRLAPTPKLSVPRLEFCALLLGVRLQNYLADNLNLGKEIKKFVWSDSKCVLAWISSNKLLPVAVEKHLTEIHNSKIHEFRYVPTDWNPADVASRGTSLKELINSYWLSGPLWLQDENTWPTNSAPTPEMQIEDQQPILFIQGQITKDIPSPFSLDPARFSSWNKLLRRTAYCIWLLNFILQKEVIKVSTPVDYEVARKMWVRWDQRRNGADDEEAIQNVPHIKKMKTFKDDYGILRCTTRIENAKVPWDTAKPSILVKGSKITELIILGIHERNFHSGTAHTLATLRKTYWLVHGRREVYRIINNACIPCKIRKAKPYVTPEEPPLPDFRVMEKVHPFQYTGIDIFGPMEVLAVETGKDVTAKRWVLLMTCLVTRAIHLEVINSMDTLDVICALKRFISRRGTPHLILSDNAAQFVLADKCIQDLWTSFSTSEAANNYFAEENIKWKFTPQYAPWMGGAYERLVKVTKEAFKKTYGEQLTSEREFCTTIIEIEAMINSRPLTYLDQELETPLLTPNHFLRACYPAIPVTIDEVEKQRLSTKENIIHCWKASERHLNYYWRIWAEQYLLSIKEIHTRIHKAAPDPPQVGDLVLMMDPGLKRGYWRKGLIERLILSTDGKCRSAQVRLTATKRMIRPIIKLIPLKLLDNAPPCSLDFSLVPIVEGPEDADESAAAEADDVDIVRFVLPKEIPQSS